MKLLTIYILDKTVQDSFSWCLELVKSVLYALLSKSIIKGDLQCCVSLCCY